MAQKGFIYEENAHKALKSYNLTSGSPAGAASDRPDLTVKGAGVELKISPTAAGSLVLKYTNGKWHFDDAYKKDPEKVFLVSVASAANLLREMNTSGTFGKNWRKHSPVMQQDPKNTRKKIYVGAKNAPDGYKIDIANFGGQNEVKIPVPSTTISDYYLKKKTQYINVGTTGFYTLGNNDPLGINKELSRLGLTKVPNWNASHSAKIRVRCQYKGSGNYQFSMTLEFSKVTKSPYNIAPMMSATNVAIDLKELQGSALIAALT